MQTKSAITYLYLCSSTNSEIFLASLVVIFVHTTTSQESTTHWSFARANSPYKQFLTTTFQ